MKDYRVSFQIGTIYHSFVITAESEDDAKAKVLRTAYHPELITNLTAERFFQEWN